MRILLANPNTTEAMTGRMAAVARGAVPAGAEIVPITAPRGFPYIASRAEAQVAGAILLEMIAPHADAVDAVVVAAFGDPGLAGARELFDVPVVGMAEAAMLTAAMLGERFSIVTFTPVMRRWYVDGVRDAGLSARFAGLRAPPEHAADLDGLREGLRDELAGLCERAAQEDGADVVILGGAPLAGLAGEIQGEVGVPLVDPVAAAAAQAVALAALVPAGALARRAAKPPAKEAHGIDAGLAGRFARRAGGETGR
jgi:Asp/Glu/hydantoin racemase